ncbi:MAG TPA: hypothetical protein VIC62_03985 [Nakamurella sp.]|jgi:hypothetical protein
MTDEQDRSPRERAGGDIADWLHGSGAVVVAVALILIGIGFVITLFL